MGGKEKWKNKIIETLEIIKIIKVLESVQEILETQEMKKVQELIEKHVNLEINKKEATNLCGFYFFNKG